MDRLLWIGLGGALGSVARYLLSSHLARRFGLDFPWGTLTVNAAGSFLLGLLLHAGLEHPLLSPNVRLGLGVGVLGGFTTFSTFSYETLRLVQSGAWGGAAANAAANLGLSLVCCALGIAAGRALA